MTDVVDVTGDQQAGRERAAVRYGPRRGDAFGAALLACWQRGGAADVTFEFIERDDGFIDVMDAARYFAVPEQWGPLDRWVCEHARGRILDVGSGAGRHSLALQERGADVVALDISPLAAEVCRRRGIKQVVTGTVAGLAQRGGAQFDTFLLLGNNLGLLSSAEEAPRFLGALAALASPRAMILGQGMDPYRTSNELHLAYHRRNRTLGRMGGQIRMRVRYQDRATNWFDYLFTTVDELRTLLAGTAWHLEHVESISDAANYAALLRYTG